MSESVRCPQRRKWHSLVPGVVAVAVVVAAAAAAVGKTGSRGGNTSAAPELALVVP